MILELSKKEEMSETERKDYCGAIFAIFPRLEKDIQEMMYEKLVETYTEADNWDKVLKGQGIMEGMAILLTKWETASNEHKANSKPEEEFDKNEVISKVG